MENIVCNGCSLLCDDVAAEVSSKKVSSLGLCKLGHTHLEAVLAKKINSNEKDVEKVAEILTNADNLLLYGWTETSNEAIREGLELASALDGHFAASVDMGAMKVMSHSIHSK